MLLGFLHFPLCISSEDVDLQVETGFCCTLYSYWADLGHFVLLKPLGRKSPNQSWGHCAPTPCRGRVGQWPNHLCAPTLPSSCSHTRALAPQQSAHGPQAMQCLHFIQHINNLKISLSPGSCIRNKRCSAALEGWSLQLNWQEIHPVPDNYNTLL